MTKKPTINRRGWLSWFLQKRRRQRANPPAEPLPPLPTVPEIVIATFYGNGVVIVEWDLTGVSYAEGIAIERILSWEDDSAYTVRGNVGGTENSFTDSVDEHLVMLIYRIRTHNAAGYSPYSDLAPVFIS